jgi:hypothetical protein
MSKLTKTKMVSNHLRSGRTITSLDAINLYSATRLSAIIFTLRQKGLIIATLPTTVIDMFGNSVTYAKYKLLDVDRDDLFSSNSVDVDSVLRPNETQDLSKDKEFANNIKQEDKGTFNKTFLQKLWSKIITGE